MAKAFSLKLVVLKGYKGLWSAQHEDIGYQILRLQNQAGET